MIILIAAIAISFLILAHELGHFLTAKLFRVRVEEFGLGFPPRLFAKKIGETVYSVNLLPFGGFVKIFGEDYRKAKAPPLREAFPPNSFADKPVWQRVAIVLAGVTMNVLAGWLLLSAVFMLGVPEHLAIADVAADSPAQVAGIKSGDIVLEARLGETALTDPVKSRPLIELVDLAAGGEILLMVRRGNEVFEVVLRGRLEPPSGQGPLGVALIDIGAPAQGFIAGLANGTSATINTLQAITLGFIAFFGSVFVDKTALEAIAGPVGIFAIAAQASALGAVYFLQFIALISLNLAILNLIPFPALDGGRFIFLLIEKIKGSPVSVRIQMAVNSLGFAFLIVLMVIVTVRDVARIIN
jgi:regulator of sigma E protease